MFREASLKVKLGRVAEAISPGSFLPYLWAHTASGIPATFGDGAAHAYRFARLKTAFMVEAGGDGSGLFADGFESGDTSGWAP